MRNPFARLAKHDTARPLLRERFASLKASASRVIRCKPVGAGPAASVETEEGGDPILSAIQETRRLTVVRAWADAGEHRDGGAGAEEAGREDFAVGLDLAESGGPGDFAAEGHCDSS